MRLPLWYKLKYINYLIMARQRKKTNAEINAQLNRIHSLYFGLRKRNDPLDLDEGDGRMSNEQHERKWALNGRLLAANRAAYKALSNNAKGNAVT